MKHNPETKRLMDVLDGLKKSKGISMYQIAKKIDYLPQSFSRVKSGGQNLPSRIIHKICEIYNINKSYIYTGQFPVFIDEKQAKLIERNGKNAEQRPLPIKVPYYDTYLTAGMLKKFGNDIVNPSYFITKSLLLSGLMVECSVLLMLKLGNRETKE